MILSLGRAARTTKEYVDILIANEVQFNWSSTVVQIKFATIERRRGEEFVSVFSALGAGARVTNMGLLEEAWAMRCLGSWRWASIGTGALVIVPPFLLQR
jgi:hypothetical protein